MAKKKFEVGDVAYLVTTWLQLSAKEDARADKNEIKIIRANGTSAYAIKVDSDDGREIKINQRTHEVLKGWNYFDDFQCSHRLYGSQESYEAIVKERAEKRRIVAEIQEELKKCKNSRQLKCALKAIKEAVP